MRLAFHEAANFMAHRCIITTSQVPYSAQLVPLAVMVALLAERPGVLSQQQAWDRIHQWFWCGVFGELYGSPALTVRISNDVLRSDQSPGPPEKVLVVKSSIVSFLRGSGPSL